MIEPMMNGTARRELEKLREEVRETSERLQQVEADNEALRERMAFRHRELEELRRRLLSASPSAVEAMDLQHRLETAENSAAALARELDRVERELELTRDRYHMVKLSEALREFDNDELTISNDEDGIVVRNGATYGATHTVAYHGRK